MSRHQQVLLSLALGVAVPLLAAPAGAAALQALPQGTWWGAVDGLPGYVNMYLYVPDRLATQPPVVVAPHHCQGNGRGTFNEMSTLVSRADQRGFIMIFPEATGQNCWDAGSSRSLTHDGKGDTHAIVQMVRYTLATYGANAARVYSVGGSSGGIMTEALLGVYPDVFMAGVSYMGVPAGCWAEGYNDVIGKPANGTGQWSGPCAGGRVTKSGQQWGDLVRSFLPGYDGHRPRLQHWHGTADQTIAPANLGEDVKEWTNVLGSSETPTGTDSPASGTTHQYWKNACGFTVYETFSLAGIGHAVPFDGNAVATYFGLDQVDGPDPETAACPGPAPGSLGAAGTGSAGAGVGDMPSGGPPPPTSGTVGSEGTLGAVDPAPVRDGTNSSSPATTNGAAAADLGATPSLQPNPQGTVAPGSTPAIPNRSAPPVATARSAQSTSGCELANRPRDFDARPAALLAVALGLAHRRRRRERSTSVS